MSETPVDANVSLMNVRRERSVCHEIDEQSGQKAREQRERAGARERHGGRVTGALQFAHLSGGHERAARHLLLARAVSRGDEHVAGAKAMEKRQILRRLVFQCVDRTSRMVPRERAGRRGEATECAPERVEDVVQSDGLRGREERARVDENLREQNGVQFRPQLLAGADVHDLVGARVQHDDAVVALGRASCEPILPVFLHQIVRESGRETEQLLLRVAFPVIF